MIELFDKQFIKADEIRNCPVTEIRDKELRPQSIDIDSIEMVKYCYGDDEIMVPIIKGTKAEFYTWAIDVIQQTMKDHDIKCIFYIETDDGKPVKLDDIPDDAIIRGGLMTHMDKSIERDDYK